MRDGGPFRHLAATALLLLMCACGSVSPSNSARNLSGRSGVGPYSTGFQPVAATLCLQRLLKEPPGPLHIAFRKSSGQGASAIEGDITPTMIEYTQSETLNGKTTTRQKHLDPAQMSELDLDFVLMGPVPWHGELAPVQNAAKAMVGETVNGAATTKYSLDSSRESGAEKATFLSLMRARDYAINGTAWVAADGGCLVKWNVDTRQEGDDGTVQRVHFEGDVVKR